MRAITIQLPDTIYQQFQQAVQKRQTSEEALGLTAIQQYLAQFAQSMQGDPVIGSFYDDAELLDAVVIDAYASRKNAPLRLVE